MWRYCLPSSCIGQCTAVVVEPFGIEPFAIWPASTQESNKARHGCESLHLFHKFRFELHGANTIDLAINIVITLNQADILDLGTYFHYQR